jgi:ABC-type Na+ efflux pump permease subunit
MQFLQSFSDDVWNTSSLIWYVSLFLTLAVAWILHSYNENALVTGTVSIMMYVSIILGNVGFSRLGVMFSADKEANLIASAGVTMCALLVMTLILARVFFAVGDMRQQARYRSQHSGEVA